MPLVLRPPRDATIPALTAPPRDDAAGFLTIAAQEKRVIAEALQRTHGHKACAAALLGLTRFQLYSRLKRYQIAAGPPCPGPAMYSMFRSYVLIIRFRWT